MLQQSTQYLPCEDLELGLSRRASNADCMQADIPFSEGRREGGSSEGSQQSVSPGSSAIVPGLMLTCALPALWRMLFVDTLIRTLLLVHFLARARRWVALKRLSTRRMLSRQSIK
jgi:hypothetical protein